jgi:hypothetical protein
MEAMGSGDEWLTMNKPILFVLANNVGCIYVSKNRRIKNEGSPTGLRVCRLLSINPPAAADIPSVI